MNQDRASDRSEVVAAIADGLTTAANPLILVDAIDLAGAAEAVELARAVGAVIDHTEPGNLALFQEQGWLGTTPGEATLRSDAVLLVGPFTESIATDEALRRLCGTDQKDRTFRYIGRDAPPGAISNLVGKGLAGTDVGHMSLTGLIGAVRAHVAGHAFTADQAARDAIAALGDWLKGARYGVAAFATGALTDVEGHALTALLDDLSLETRWNALPLSTPSGQNELQRMSASLTGLPAPVAFVDSRPIHDPWKFAAKNLIARGETDTVLWISSSDRTPPDWIGSIANVFAISAHDAALANVKLQGDIGVAGVDHAAIMEPAEIGAFATMTPPEPSGRDSAACVIGAIRETIEHEGVAA